jgi:transposase
MVLCIASKITQAQWERWDLQGPIVFFLAPYCSQMNAIEGEWHQLKAHEMAGQMFDNVYDLAMAVEACVEQRYQNKGYNVSRFIFNSA